MPILVPQGEFAPVDDETCRSQRRPVVGNALQGEAELDLTLFLEVVMGIQILHLPGSVAISNETCQQRREFLRRPTVGMDRSATMQIQEVLVQLVWIMPGSNYWRMNWRLTEHRSTEVPDVLIVNDCHASAELFTNMRIRSGHPRRIKSQVSVRHDEHQGAAWP